VPALAIGMGWVILGEAPPGLAIVGGAIAIVGVVIARSAPRRTVSVASPAIEAEPTA
jgi:drug/metabolite transporter (DMT)-like permease